MGLLLPPAIAGNRPADPDQPSRQLAAIRQSQASGEPTTSTTPTQLIALLKQLQQQIRSKAQPLSLTQAIDLGLRNSPQLLTTFETIRQYEWQLIAAKRQWNPTVQLSNGTPFVGYQWQSFVQNYSTGIQPDLLQVSQRSSLNTRALINQPGATISWNVIDPMRQPNINAAADSLRQQKYLFAVSARNLILDIQQAYYGIQSSQQLIDSFEQIYAINQQQLTILEALKKIGMVTVLDLAQTRSQLFIQLSQLVTYTQAYIDQTARLSELLALPQDTLAIPADAAGLQGRWSLSLEETVARARRQREEILASLAAAEASSWAAVTALRSYLPVFSLVGNGSFTSLDGSESGNGLLGSGSPSLQSRQWTLATGIGFSWSLFDGGIQDANAKAARAQAQQQKAQAVQTELQVVQQVRSSYALLQTSMVALESARQAYRSAELAQEAARARFSVGVGDITSVVQAIQQLSQAAEQTSQAMFAYNTSLAQLYRYSATWPGDSEAELNKRLRVMPPTSSSLQGSLSAP